MYAIANMIYGLPLVANKGKHPFKEYPCLAAAVESEVAGFLSFDSSAADEMPQAFGVAIGEFHEACAYVKMSKIPMVPTTKQRNAYLALFEALKPEIQAPLRKLGDPFVFIMWSSS